MTDDDLIDLYEDAPCGYLSLTSDGRIARINGTLSAWVGAEPGALVGRPIHTLLSFGGRIAYETHLAPLLRLQGFVDEIALDLMYAEGEKVPVIANARERRSADGEHLFTRMTLFRAVERRRYERELKEARTESDAKAEAEHEISLLREQFIAVLGHDLRNPLAALDAGIRMLNSRENLSDRGKSILREMAISVLRASALTENVMDFARGRLGSGFNLKWEAREPLAPVLEHVIGEIRAVWPEREILSHFEMDRPVGCDHMRIAQLASNLIANAVTHGAPDKPIVIEATTGVDRFVFSVANGGEPIPPAAAAQLFQPFFRGSIRKSQQGLGLGLFIVNEIAKAHDGSMDVTSSPEETRFTFSMPMTPG